jgi:hypothetical protein
MGFRMGGMPRAPRISTGSVHRATRSVAPRAVREVRHASHTVARPAKKVESSFWKRLLG